MIGLLPNIYSNFELSVQINRSRPVMPILAPEALLRKNKKKSVKNVTPSEDWTQGLWFQAQHSPFWANLDYYAKNQVVHEQKFKDPPK